MPFAHAQGDGSSESQLYDPTYTGVVNEAAEAIKQRQRESLMDKGFITPDAVQVDVVHHTYMEDDQFGIQMAVPDMISGCYTLTPLEYEAKFVDPHFLDIKVKKYRRVAPEGSAANRKCDAQNKMSTALMVLSKQDLMSRGTQAIRFSADAGSDTYKIILDDTHLELVPQSMMVFKLQNPAGPLKDRALHSFASDKMIALQIPMARAGEDVSDEIAQFAKSRALAPTSADAPVSWAAKGTPTYYFYDDSGRFSAQIGENGYAEIGTITVQRPADGPDGRTTTDVDLSVFITRPGTQL